MDPKVVELPAYPDSPSIDEPLLRNGLAAPRLNGSTEIRNGTIFADKLVVGSRQWVHNLTWTATDYNTATWSSGTIQMADGTTYSITGADTGNVSGTVYLYLDIDVSITTLQQSATYSDAIGNNKFLLAIVTAASDTGAKCIISAFGSEGTTIDGAKVVTGKIQSTDGKTYFDLDAKYLLVNDGTNNRVHAGYLSGKY